MTTRKGFLMCRITILLSISLLAGGCLFLPARRTTEGTPSFTFVHITDPQFGMYKAFKETEGYEQERQDFSRAIHLIGALRPDFTAITGDLIEQWNDEEQLRLFRDYRNALEKVSPVYLTPGNHDMPPTAEGLAFYRERYGDDYFSMEHRGCHLIFLNSNLINFEERLPEEARKQWEWLEEELKRANQRKVAHIFVFQHHPYYVNAADEADEYFNVPTPIRKRYLDLLARHRVSAVFAGHLHRDKVTQYEGIQMITTSSLGKPLGETPAGFRLVRVTGRQIEHQYMPVIPE